MDKNIITWNELVNSGFDFDAYEWSDLEPGAYDVVTPITA